jgi:hypothetical protein
MSGDEPASVKVTLPVIYETLLEVKEIATQAVAGVANHTEQIRDHESRIRTLEARVWQAAGACAVLGIIAGSVASRLFT